MQCLLPQTCFVAAAVISRQFSGKPHLQDTWILRVGQHVLCSFFNMACICSIVCMAG